MDVARSLRHTGVNARDRGAAMARRGGAMARRAGDRAAVAAVRRLGERRQSGERVEGFDEAVVAAFHQLYYASDRQTWQNTFWRGTTIWKCPLDLWLYQEMLHEVQPDLVVETGTAFGGSAAYLAALCDVFDRGRVVSIDLHYKPGRPEHPRVTYLTGSSTDPGIVAQVEAMLPASGRVLVVLDSDHRRDHVLEELRVYSRFVPVGSYVVVEDTNVNGHPTYPDFGPGPMEAVEAFLAVDTRFEVDRSKEKFFLTFNPGGYLRRVR